jgi:deoxycytidine triphosphate deaminase
MFIHPVNASTEVTNIDETMIQPNTIDLRVDKVYRIGAGAMHMDEDKKEHRKSIEQKVDENGNYVLTRGTCYEIQSNQHVDIAEGEIAILIGRSTFNRNGVLIISSIYDSGFKDYAGATLYNIGGETTLKPNTRFAHLVIAKAETLHKYDGDYGEKN